MQIYLAAPFFSDEQIDRVARIEAALEANPTVTDFYSPRHHGLQKYSVVMSHKCWTLTHWLLLLISVMMMLIQVQPLKQVWHGH